jgi:Tol biopolymer transport system component
VDGGWRDLTPSAEPGIHFTEPGVSPDGRLLAVSGTDGSVRVLTREGDEVLELVGNDPAWCPDSQHLVYAVTEDGLHEIAASELFVVAVDGSRARIALTDTPDRIEQRPDVAPDGSAVIFDAGGAIWRLPLAGGCRARLAAAEG